MSMQGLDLNAIRKMVLQQIVEWFKTKLTKEQYNQGIEEVEKIPSEKKEEWREGFERACDEFYKTDEYKSGDYTIGYLCCCGWYGFCGGMSGWIIALIIFIILGVCTSGAAAFWFFYWNRKRGGQEEQVEEGKEDTESTNAEDPKGVIEIPVGTY
ncbi:unnamed protein product [Caenorhabditis brenneri]